MNKLVKQNLFEFTRGSDPFNTLGIGYAAKIYKFFDDLGVDREIYTIEGKQIKFIDSLYLDNNLSLVELPNNLIFGWLVSLKNCINLVKLPEDIIIPGSLSLDGCTSLVELPHNLSVGTYLSLEGCTKIIQLPKNLQVKTKIYVNPEQTELIKWIKLSKFQNQLKINYI